VAAPAEVLDAGGTPVGVVVGTDGTAYVGNYDGAGGVRVIPPGAARPSRTISTHVSGLAMAPDGTLYVAHQDSATGKDVVGVIPAGGAGVARSIPVSRGNHLIAAGPDGTIYVTSISSNHVAVIEPGAETVAYNIPVPGGPQEAAVGHDGTLYVTGVLNRVLSRIPPGATAVGASIPTDSNPGRLAVAPDGTVIVASPGNGTGNGSVSRYAAGGLPLPAAPMGPGRAPIGTCKALSAGTPAPVEMSDADFGEAARKLASAVTFMGPFRPPNCRW
jgi:YVTN family beta-propeller protein